MTKLSTLAATVLIAAGAVHAAPAAASTCVDICVAYPYYGAYTTESSVSAVATQPSMDASADVCVVYPYYGETTTPSAASVQSQGLAETPEELQRVLAGFGRDQYLGL